MKRAVMNLSIVLCCCLAGRQLPAQESHVQPAYFTTAPGATQVVQPVGYEQGLVVTPASSASARITSDDLIIDSSDSTSCVAGCTAGCSEGCVSGCGGGRCARGCRCLFCQNRTVLSRTYGGLEYMFWWSDARRLPALVTTSPAGTPPAAAGVLGLPTTSVLFGNDEVGGSDQAGGRITLGLWLNDCQNLAVFGRFYGAEGENNGFQSTPGGAIIARPFFNNDPLVNAPDALLVNFPGLSAGSNFIEAANDVYGGDLSLRTLLDAGNSYRVDLISGFQYNRIDDDLVMRSNVTAGATTFAFEDVFDVENTYTGGATGLLGEYTRGIFTLSMLAKISLGNMEQRAAIRGSNTVTVGGGAPTTTPGGLLTQPTNIGVRERDVFAVSPEAGLNLSVAVTQNIDFTVGYTFLYWNRVALAGGLVDTNVNGTQLLGGALVGPATPAFNWNNDQFWIQTLNLGMNWRY